MVFALIRRIRDSRLPQLTLMEALAQVEALTNVEGLDLQGSALSRNCPGKDDPYIANQKLPANVAKSISALFATDGGVDTDQVRRTFLLEAGVPEEEMKSASVTRILLSKFPKLQLRNLWVTTGGPKLNSFFCWFVLHDLVTEFNTWALESGFDTYVKSAYRDRNYEGEFKFGDVEMCLTSPWRWSGVAEAFSLKGDRLTLSWRDSTHGFFGFTYDTTLENAVDMLDTFMQNWTPAAIQQAA